MPQFLTPSPLGKTVEVTELESLSKGQIIVGDGTGAPAKLTVGSDGYLLAADSGEATGLIWQSVASGTIPIGGVIPWLKTLSGVPALPSQFLECDGSTVSDASSPLDGVALPDLNGNNYFMRGNSTSGGTGGSATHSHGQTGGTDFQGPGTRDVANASSLPPYYDVVWVIRIK